MIIGRLGKEPDLRSTSNGKSVCKFTVATTHKTKDIEETDWHNVVTWGKVAEACANNLGKGKQVYVEGRSKRNEFEDKDGNLKSFTEIVANKVLFL